jgi:hypothetical protein
MVRALVAMRGKVSPDPSAATPIPALAPRRMHDRDGLDGLPWSVSADLRGRRGKWISYATYTYIAPQPDNGTVRNTESWRAWCLAEKAKLQA